MQCWKTPSPNFHAVNIDIFSLVHQLSLHLALTFVPLHYLLGQCLDIYIFKWEELIYGKFEDCIGFYNSHYCSFYFKSPLGNTPVTVAILQKCLGPFLSYTSAISLTLIFMSPPIPKLITDAVYLISSAWKNS